jgi:hypothetical protein
MQASDCTRRQCSCAKRHERVTYISQASSVYACSSDDWLYSVRTILFVMPSSRTGVCSMTS